MAGARAPLSSRTRASLLSSLRLLLLPPASYSYLALLSRTGDGVAPKVRPPRPPRPIRMGPRGAVFGRPRAGPVAVPSRPRTTPCRGRGRVRRTGGRGGERPRGAALPRTGRRSLGGAPSSPAERRTTDGPSGSSRRTRSRRRRGRGSRRRGRCRGTAAGEDVSRSMPRGWPWECDCGREAATGTESGSRRRGRGREMAAVGPHGRPRGCRCGRRVMARAVRRCHSFFAGACTPTVACALLCQDAVGLDRGTAGV